MADLTNDLRSPGELVQTQGVSRPGTAGKRPGTAGNAGGGGLMSVFRGMAVSSTHKAPEIYADPNKTNAIVSSTNRDDTLLRIMRARSVAASDRLIALTEKGDHAGVADMLKEGADLPNCVGMHGFTPLHHACSRNQSAVVSVLIRFKADIMQRNHAGETPLHLAAYAGNLLVVEQLLDCGADIDATNQDGETTLFYAARQTKPAMVRLLLQRGADKSVVDKFGDLATDQADDDRTRAALEEHELDLTSLTERADLSPAAALPYTELLHVLGFLGAHDLGRAAMVSGKWHRASECEDLWKRLGVRRWELALQCSLGFGAAAASSFARPSSGGRSKLKSR